MSVTSPAMPHARLAAAVCLVAGFGVMAVASLVGRFPEPGMWRYWSGTVGDLILLPAVIYGLTRAVTLLPDPGRSRSRWLVAAAGGAAGAAAQASWLLDPAPRVNWMLVRAHTFSWIGWYHAIFLCVVAAYIAGVTWELLRRTRAAPPPPWMLGGNGCALVLSAAAMFVLTAVADSLPSAATASSLATMAAIALAPVAMLAASAALLGRSARGLLGPLAVAVATSVAAVCVVRGFQQHSLLPTVALICGVVVALALRPRGPFLRSTDLRMLAGGSVTAALVSAAGVLQTAISPA
ncbi:hypothetical protein AB0K60_16615 [Thermopolyspora sp. NPDC052614]|uniref:hypothetical protein n=1 Tax=Thermopolyspora sp. NPDC052614 TaxID=3155682 RepID=UPI00343B61F0